MISSNDFVHDYKLKTKATSTIKIQQVPSSLSLNDVGIYLRDEPISSAIGIIILHPSKGIHWVVYINEIFFDTYGCVSPRNYLVS